MHYQKVISINNASVIETYTAVSFAQEAAAYFIFYVPECDHIKYDRIVRLSQRSLLKLRRRKIYKSRLIGSASTKVAQKKSLSTEYFFTVQRSMDFICLKYQL